MRPLRGPRSPRCGRLAESLRSCGSSPLRAAHHGAPRRGNERGHGPCSGHVAAARQRQDEREAAWFLGVSWVLTLSSWSDVLSTDLHFSEASLLSPRNHELEVVGGSPGDARPALRRLAADIPEVSVRCCGPGRSGCSLPVAMHESSVSALALPLFLSFSLSLSLSLSHFCFSLCPSLSLSAPLSRSARTLRARLLGAWQSILFALSEKNVERERVGVPCQTGWYPVHASDGFFQPTADLSERDFAQGLPALPMTLVCAGEESCPTETLKMPGCL